LKPQFRWYGIISRLRVIRERLEECARRYRSRMLQPKLAQRRRSWQQIERQCEKLKRAFSICAEQRLADLRADWPPEAVANVGALYDRQVKALVELQDIATAHVDFYVPRGNYDFDYLQLGFDMNKPQWKFQFAILEMWVRLGGKLRFSRNSRGEISGPLARYFFAVTRPVMGPSTPSPETFRKIVARFKDAMRKIEMARNAGDKARGQPISA
jgi:hypothetical protein